MNYLTHVRLPEVTGRNMREMEEKALSQASDFFDVPPTELQVITNYVAEPAVTGDTGQVTAWKAEILVKHK